VILLTLPQILHWIGAQGIHVPDNPGGISSSWIATDAQAFQNFVSIVVSHFVPVPELPIYCVLADTGFEHQTPISAKGWVRIRCESLAHPVPLSVVRNPNKTYLEMVERRGRFPSAQYRQCISDLKRGPIERFIRSLGYKVVTHCMGIRAEESDPARNCSRGR